jgi:ATP adenylyltransferase
VTDPACPFCSPLPERVFHEGRLVIGLWDGFPLSPGHALLVPRRHIATWFEAVPDEQHEIAEAITKAREAILERHNPDGFNVGMNLGESAGQTVPHLHVHVIPRYSGDVEDPRGGVRWVLPQRAAYWRRDSF